MKAIQLDTYGGPEVLQFRDVSDPVAGPGEITVDIHAASVNPVDSKIRTGARQDRLPMTLPYIPGVDFSGVVRVAGADVTDFAAGTAVFGITQQIQQSTYAEAIAGLFEECGMPFSHRELIFARGQGFLLDYQLEFETIACGYTKDQQGDYRRQHGDGHWNEPGEVPQKRVDSQGDGKLLVKPVPAGKHKCK